MNVNAMVFVLDDDEACSRALERLIRSCGFAARSWNSATEFLSQHEPEVPGCLLCDLIMPEMSGLEVQRELNSQGNSRPIVFMTGHSDLNAVVEGMRGGAVTFIAKPIQREALIECVLEALAKDTVARSSRAEQVRVEALLKTLTPREHEILDLVSQGILNKLIAAELGIAEKTVKVHRGRIMQKMRVKSAAALARLLSSVVVAKSGERRRILRVSPVGAGFSDEESVLNQNTGTSCNAKALPEHRGFDSQLQVVET